jgi:hypothetical protein
LDIEGCRVTQAGILNLLQSHQLVFVEISSELNDRNFLDQVRRLAPNLIVMCDGQDLMNQPEATFDQIPWNTWE